MTAEDIINVQISQDYQGQTVQLGAALLTDNSIREVSRDLSEGQAWTIGRILARPRKTRRTVQQAYELAPSFWPPPR